MPCRPLVDLPEPARSCVLAAIAGRLDDGGDWRSTNFSREGARAVLDRLDPLDPACANERM